METALEEELVSLFAQKVVLEHAILTKLRLFDASEEWSRQGFLSCAHWLAFRCGLTLGAARERVRAARALENTPKIDAAFAEGKLSYAKVRALTRIADTENEEELLQVATAATAMQLDRIVRGWQKIDRLDEEKRDEQRGCHAFFDESGMCVVSAKLRPEEGALLMQALEACRMRGQSLADALVEVATRALVASDGAKTSAEGGNHHHVVVHTDASYDNATVEGRTGDRVRTSAEVFRKMSCDATITKVTHDHEGAIIDVGRKTRRISTKMRLALVDRDGGCKFPGCTNRFTDAHHIKHWSNGGETKLANLILLCGFHHGFVHDGKALLGEDCIFRDVSGREITAMINSTPALLPSPPNDALPIPFNQRLDLAWTLSVMHPKARNLHNAASEMREAQ